MPALTAARLRELLHYDPETGIFRWRKWAPGRKPDLIAGSPGHSKGYITLHLCGKTYYAHRLAWFYVHGRWPRPQCDHINRNKTDNRVENLREANPAQQTLNSGLRADNASGFKGIYWDSHCERWCAVIWASGKRVWNRRFKTLAAANEARAAVVGRYHDSNFMVSA